MPKKFSFEYTQWSQLARILNMHQQSVSCSRVPGHGVISAALDRKAATAASNSALLWLALNFVVCAIIVSFFDSPYVQENIACWWVCVLSCALSCLCLLTHLYCYLRPIVFLSPVTVTGTQQKLLSLLDNECTTPGKGSPSVATSPSKHESFSDVLQQSLCMPSSPVSSPTATPAELSATMLNTSALSWAASFVATTPADLSATMLNTSALSWASSFGGSPKPGRPATCPYSNKSSPMNFSQSWNNSPSFNCSGGGCNCMACAANLNSSAQFYSNSPINNSSFNSTGYGTSPNQSSFLGSPVASSWSFLPQMAPSSPSSTPAPACPLRLPTSTPITSRRQLNAYIAECEQIKTNVSTVHDVCSGGGGGLWSYSHTPQHCLADTSASLLKRNTYQKALPDPVGGSGSGGSASASDANKNEPTSASNSQTAKLWAKRSVTPRQLFQFEENLRIWLCGAVVQPLVRGIDDVNKSLADVAPELQIGTVGVEKLRKACTGFSALSGVRQLSGLVPFLERCPGQQQYLVTRLRQLGDGGALSAYTWDKGGNTWTDQCPSDALLLLQLFSLYLDSQLPPDPSQSDGRVFSYQHVVITPDKPTCTDKAILHVTQTSPPHCRVILPGEGECDVGSGHKNMLHCLLLFLHHLVHAQHSHIAGVNLALTGVNLAWVVTPS